jgi:hypothetical protein
MIDIFPETTDGQLITGLFGYPCVSECAEWEPEVGSIIEHKQQKKSLSELGCINSDRCIAWQQYKKTFLPPWIDAIKGVKWPFKRKSKTHMVLLEKFFDQDTHVDIKNKRISKNELTFVDKDKFVEIVGGL